MSDFLLYFVLPALVIVILGIGGIAFLLNRIMPKGDEW